MRVPGFSLALLATMLAALTGGHVFGQASKILSAGKCPPTADLEKSGYIVRSSRVDTPFELLTGARRKNRRAAAAISALLDGRPFLNETASRKAFAIIDAEDFFPPSSFLRIRIRLEFVTAENCGDRSLDLVYHVLSTGVDPEQRQTSARPGRIDFVPVAGYDAEDKLSAGGRLDAGPLTVNAEASEAMRSVTATMSRQTDSTRWIAHSRWSLSFNSQSLPTGDGEIKNGQLWSQYSVISKVFGNGHVHARFGGLLTGGNEQSALANIKLPTRTVARAGFGAARLYAGLDFQSRRQVLTTSYGLEFGAVAPIDGIGWRKHIGDIRHEIWYPVGDHRILDVESRLTAGTIQVPGTLPLPSRFFGGSREQTFIADDAWHIRANPVIRAIPGIRLFETARGAGADRFIGYNLTAAWAAWRRPLVTRDISGNQTFQFLLAGQIASATSIETLHFVTKDPAYRSLASLLPGVQNSLANLKSSVAAAPVSEGVAPCLSAIKRAAGRARSAAKAKPDQQYALISALLAVSAGQDEDRLAKVSTTCLARFGEPAQAVEKDRLEMENDFSAIDQTFAASKARREMAIVRQTLRTLFTEVNAWSVSPVLVFDAVRIPAGPTGLSGTRYGPGAGIRAGVAGSVNFTAGYAWNVRQGPGEGPGAFFFQIGSRDLFR